MAGFKRRKWLLRGIVLSLVTGVCLLLKIHSSTDSASESPIQVGVDATKRSEACYPVGMSGNERLKLITADVSTVINTPWPETDKALSLCRELKYDSLGALPSASVVVTFHDTETVSSLLRTIHSIVQRTPCELLREVIVIDDYSKNDDLGQILDIYLGAVFADKVRLIRNSANEGLIRSRLIGSRLARGDVIVFMDSHSEVQPGWLEPLLYEIKRNRKTLAHSYIDWMQKKNGTWHYTRGGCSWIVYFDWRLLFGWQPLPKQEEARRSPTDPLRTKVIIGAYAAIDRLFFQEIGEFDEGMEFWGGENIDLSLRVWLFGGQVLTVPCSRVGHLEATDSRSYRNAYSRVIERNYKRVVEVWFDDYKSYFYLYYPTLAPVDPGYLEGRMELKSRALNNFSWYLQNVFPELGLPDRDSFAWGKIRNSRRPLCLMAYTSVALTACISDHRQIFYWSNKFEFRQPMSVFNLLSTKVRNGTKKILSQIQYIPFFNNDLAAKWIHWKNGPLLELETQLCLTVSTSLQGVDMVACDYHHNPDQIWEFEHYTEQYTSMVTTDYADKPYKYIRAILLRLKPPSSMTSPNDGRTASVDVAPYYANTDRNLTDYGDSYRSSMLHPVHPNSH